VIVGNPTTMIPLQKLLKSCRPISWVMTTMARLLERIVVVLLADDVLSNAPAGGVEFSRDGTEARVRGFDVSELY